MNGRAHGKRSLDAFYERSLHELLFGEHPSCTYETVEIDPSSIERAVEVVHRVFNRVVFGDEVDKLIVHDRRRAHEFVNGWVTFAFQFGDPSLSRVDGLPQPRRHTAADVPYGLEPAHLVPDRRDSRQKVRLLST